jgi:hypothetical protein
MGIGDILAANPPIISCMASRMPTFLHFVRLFAGLSFAAAAQTPLPAPAPSNPYEAVVPLTDPSATGQDAALREALAAVLAKVTSLPEIRSQPAAAPVLAQAAQLVQHYGEERDPATRLPMFRAAFDPRSVDEALKRQGLPVWGQVAGAEQDWPVTVRYVNDFRSYGRALNALRRVRGVRTVSVQTVEGDSVSLKVRFEGDANALTRAIATQGQLREAGQFGGQLIYTLAPGS